jgi:hypothetical protein
VVLGRPWGEESKGRQNWWKSEYFKFKKCWFSARNKLQIIEINEKELSK